MLEHIEKASSVKVKLHLNIIEAELASPKDSNGNASLFATFFFSSDPTICHKTAVESDTLTPTWNEHFDLYSFFSLKVHETIE